MTYDCIYSNNNIRRNNKEHLIDELQTIITFFIGVIFVSFVDKNIVNGQRYSYIDYICNNISITTLFDNTR